MFSVKMIIINKYINVLVNFKLVNICKIIIGYVGIVFMWIWIFSVVNYDGYIAKFITIFVSLAYSTLSEKNWGIFHYIIRDGIDEKVLDRE